MFIHDRVESDYVQHTRNNETYELNS